MLEAPDRVRETVWAAGRYGLHVIDLAFPDARRPLPSSWGSRVVAEMDAYFREASGGALRWSLAGVQRVQLPYPSKAFHLVRRRLRDRVRFWQTVVAAAGIVAADAMLVVVPPSAAVRGCFAQGPRWHSPRLAHVMETLRSPAMRGAIVHASSPWGTIAHELGHVLGLPDLYDYDAVRSARGGDPSRFVGGWDLMGRVPEEVGDGRPHPMAWTKTLAGWITPVDFRPGQDHYLIGHAASGAAPLRVSLGGSRWLFAEGRLRQGFDAVLPGEGVLLSIADETVPEGRGPLRVLYPGRLSGPSPEAAGGPLGDAALHPGDRYVGEGYQVTVQERIGEAFEVRVQAAA